MADSTSPPAFDLNKGIYFPQLTEMFVISQDPAYDYYSTNSGMYPKNPGGGGGGGETSALVNRVATLEDEMDDVQQNQSDLSAAALSGMDILSDGYILSNDITEIEHIITNQNKLRDSQENLYKAATSITL